MKGNKMQQFRQSALGVVLTGAALCSAATAWAAPVASLQGLGGLGAVPPETSAYGVSSDGTTVVGTSKIDSASCFLRAFRWQDGTMEDLGSSNGAVAHAVNADGSRVVGFTIFQGSHRTAFLWTEPPIFQPGPGLLTQLGVLQGGLTSLALDVTIRSGGDIVIVGKSDSDDGTRAFRWNDVNNQMMDLGKLNEHDFHSEARGVSADGTVVIGTSGDRAFRWVGNDAGGTMLELSGQPANIDRSSASGVSADGRTIVGTVSIQLPGQLPVATGYRWTEAGGMEALPLFPLAISDDGLTIVGTGGLVWREGIGVRSISDVLACAGVDVTGWLLGNATGVSADGTTIVGHGSNPSGEDEGWIAKMPPLLVAAESELFHQTVMYGGLAGAIPAGDSECRNIGGAVHIIIRFDADAFSADGDGFAPGDFTVQNGTVTLVGGGPKTVSLDITNVIDAACLSISFVAEDANGNEACYVLEWPILLGDADNNGVVDANDEALLISKSGETLPATNFRCDLNLNGTIQADPQGDHSDLDLVVVASPPTSASCP